MLNNKISPDIEEMGKNAKMAALELKTLSGSARQNILALMPEKLESIKKDLFLANQSDLKKARKAGLSEPFIKRLEITEKIYQYMLNRLKKVASMPDPVDKILEGHTRPDGLQVKKVSVPIGVIGIIYESRPNVTTDAASVCLKSGNAVILRGGSESIETNIVLAEAMIAALEEYNAPKHAIQILRTPGHEAVSELLRMNEYIDVLIPRGGKELIKKIAQGTNIPVIKHYEGICHLYIAKDADVEMAIDVAVNSKCQRVEVCNALETLLIDQKIAPAILPKIVSAFKQNNIKLLGCHETIKLAPSLEHASEEDWMTEYLAPILSIKIVKDIDEAIRHINYYGSGHTDSIITESLALADKYVNCVDSASVLVNASTRLSGGGDYGLGAVVGISTDKLHARGPVGPQELTTYKWIVHGHGHLRN